MSLAPPVLRRCTAIPQDECFLPSDEALKLQLTVKSAYKNIGFKGPALVLPCGIVVCDDMWMASLENLLDVLTEDGVAALKAFSLENWLVGVVQQNGSADQKTKLNSLLNELADLEAEDELRSFYSRDILSPDFQMQPLSEVEVYRGLNLDDDDDDAGPLSEDEEYPVDFRPRDSLNSLTDDEDVA